MPRPATRGKPVGPANGLPFGLVSAHPPTASVVVARALLRSGVGRRVREDLDISAALLAERIGVAESTVRRWEKSCRRPRPGMAVRYLAAIMELTDLREDVLRNMS